MCLSQAETELFRVASLSTFNVEGAAKRQPLNDFTTRYLFVDGSRLEVNTRQQVAKVFFPSGVFSMKAALRVNQTSKRS